MESQLVATQQVVLLSNLIRVTYQIAKFPDNKDHSSLTLSMTDSTYTIPVEFPFGYINIYPGNVAWENSQVSIANRIQAGGIMALSFTPYDSSYNRINSEFVSMHLEVDCTGSGFCVIV